MPTLRLHNACNCISNFKAWVLLLEKNNKKTTKKTMKWFCIQSVSAMKAPRAIFLPVTYNSKSQSVFVVTWWISKTLKKEEREIWMSIHVWCKRMRVKFLYSELQTSLSSSEGHLMSVLPSLCLSWEPVPHPAAPAYRSIMHQGLISQMQPSANPISPQARSGS